MIKIGVLLFNGSYSLMGCHILTKSFISSMSYEPLDGEVYAQRHHANLRKVDTDAPAGIHPLLSTHSEVSPLPSSREMSKIFDRICGKRHQGHSRKSPDKCYLYYSSKCDPGGYGPKIPRTLDLPFPKTALPGKAPVLEHLFHLLKTQDTLLAGGSFYESLSDTINLCRSNRQVSESTLPQVHTLIFGRSSESEVSAFVGTFNKRIKAQERSRLGWLPHNLYSFDVESISSLPGVPYRIQHTKRGVTTARSINSKEKQPARVHLGFHDERFDIVFPWEFSNMSEDFRAEWTLVVPSDPLPDLWHQLFCKLQGHAIGIGIHEDLSQLDSFISACFRFKNATGPLRIRKLDLEVLLALAGYNSPKTSITALNFFFTGGVVQKKWEVRCGLGKWATTTALPHCLNLYLQSEVIGVLNVALIALMSILVHWFVTPGIAAVAARKTPVKFISWFWRFIHSILLDARLSSGFEFSNCGDRIEAPSQLISRISYGNRRTPVFTSRDLALCIPPWRNVTGGGCPSDQYAFDHILTMVWPILRRPGVPLHLRWESDLRVISKFLTGQPLPSASSKTSRETGCNPDPSTLSIPMLTPDKTACLPHLTLRRLYIDYRETLEDSDPIKSLTSSQILLLSTWQHPREISRLLAKNEKRGRKYFTRDDYFLIMPLVAALTVLDASQEPPFSMKYSIQQDLHRDTKRAEFLTKRLSQSLSTAGKRLLRAKIRRIHSKWARLKESTRAVYAQGSMPFLRSPPTLLGPRELFVQQPLPPPPSEILQSGDPEVNPPQEQSGPSSSGDETTEVRRVRFTSPPPDDMEWEISSSTTDHELVVDTPDWEDL